MTHVSSVTDAIREVKLAVGESGQQVGYRAAGGVPATEGTRGVSVRELPPECGCPAFAYGRVPAVDDCPIEFIDVRSGSGCRHILGRLCKTEWLTRELGFCETKLTRRHEVVRRLARSGRGENIGREVGWKRVQCFQNNVLVGRPRVRSIPGVKSRKLINNG